MAINDPKRKLISITVKEVDPELLADQRNKLCSVLRVANLKLSSQQRSALFGIKNLLNAMLPEEGSTPRKTKRVRMTAELVNQAKDLLEDGYTVDAVRIKLAVSRNSIDKVRNGLFDKKFKYEPSIYKLLQEGATQ